MSWAVVARKDFRDARRSRLLWGLTALFVLVVGGLAFGFVSLSGLDGGETADSLGFVVFLSGVVGLFVPVVAVLVGYKSIAGERESGTITFLLGLPHSRRDVIVGKVLGRSAILAVALLAAFAVAAAILLGLGGGFSPLVFGLFALLTVFYAVTFVAAAVGISSLTGSTSQAAAGAVGFWLFDQGWGFVVLIVLVLASGISLPQPPFPAWYQALASINPSAAYSTAANFFLPAGFAQEVQAQLGGLPEWYGLVVLAVWILLVLVLGTLRFERVDL